MKIYLMHQTHTDIGYTDRQEKITKYHVDYLKQAITISEAIVAGRKEWEGFVWTNETNWILERFLEATDKKWHERLFTAIKNGHIQLAGNYLNLTDLVDPDILRKYLKRGKAFADDHDIRLDSAVSMDINGWTWGYAQALIDAGLKNFFTCIHNHHGFVPFEKKHVPFYWETENGDKILVWQGDVYNQGNVSRLMPDVIGETDEAGNHTTRAIITDEQLAYAKKWLDDYIESMRAQGYDYDFMPLMTKGLLVDNAPPNPHIMESLKAFNDKYKDEIELEMVGLNDFFDIIRKKNLKLETHKGDWNDWWSDGFASTPKAVMTYKEAQRNYKKITHLKDAGFAFSEAKLEQLEYNLMMFSEHTWGYFTSVSEPWNKMAQKLDERNQLFAHKASKLSDTLIDDYTEAKGEMAKAAGRPLLYKITNPYPKAKTAPVKLYINWWDDFLIKGGYRLVNAKTKETIPHQQLLVDERKRKEVNAFLSLNAFESVVLEIVPEKKTEPEMPLDPLFTRDTTYDYVSPYLDNTLNATQFFIDTPHMRIEWDKEEGIHSLKDKKTGQNLLREDSECGFFTPVYEVSEIEYTYKFDVPEMSEVRKDYGRNRKLFSTLRDYGRLINVKVLDKGPLIARVQLKYELKGTRHCIVELMTYRDQPRLDVALIIQKDTVWEPENLYLALPFTTQSEETLYLEKSGAVIRPRIDQLPKTQSLFYTTQSGYAINGEKRSIHISMPDTPLLHMGGLDAGLIKIHNGSLDNTDRQYAWIMNNYWETNFQTNLGGFYRFEYQIAFQDAQKDKQSLLEITRNLQETFLSYQVKNHES